MAERRMFAKTIVLSDAFLDMPMTARNLYFTLGMLADDDGFVNAPRSIMRQCGASDDDMKILISKKFVLLFESGVIVIKHWRINNYLRNDRYQETKYLEEKAQLAIDEKGGYHRASPAGIPTGIPNSGIPRIGKDSIGEDSIGKDNNPKNNSFNLSERVVGETNAAQTEDQKGEFSTDFSTLSENDFIKKRDDAMSRLEALYGS